MTALGGDYPGNFALDSTKALATNVTGITILVLEFLDFELSVIVNPQFLAPRRAPSFESSHCILHIDK